MKINSNRQYDLLEEVVADNGFHKVKGYIGGWDKISDQMFYLVFSEKGSIWASENSIERVVPITLNLQ